jgi:hypothetical protein
MRRLRTVKNLPAFAAGLSLAVCQPLLGLGTNAQQKQRAAVPNTPAGQQLAGFLRAYNTGELATLREFIAGHFERDALAERSAEAQARALPDPAPSVTEHTTRAFEPIYSERKPK